MALPCFCKPCILGATEAPCSCVFMCGSCHGKSHAADRHRVAPGKTALWIAMDSHCKGQTMESCVAFFVASPMPGAIPWNHTMRILGNSRAGSTSVLAWDGVTHELPRWSLSHGIMGWDCMRFHVPLKRMLLAITLVLIGCTCTKLVTYFARLKGVNGRFSVFCVLYVLLKSTFGING